MKSYEKNKPVKKSLSASMEDYLEAIYWLSRQHGVARVSHIAERLRVGKSSVTAALKHLAEKGHVNYDPYQYISLTSDGEEKALEIVHRHEVLKRFFMEILSIDEELAEESACKMEHSIDEEVLDRLLRYVESVQSDALKE